MDKIRKPSIKRPHLIILPSFAWEKKILSEPKPYIPLPSYYPPHAQKFFLRECISRVSYNSGNSATIERSTRSAIDYLLKNEDVPLLSSKQSLTNIDSAQEFFKGKRILRICISPEDNGAPLDEAVRKTIKTIEEKIGHKLVYLAATHTDTDRLHAHIIISREDGGNLSKTNLLVVPNRVLIKDCRETMRRVITDHLGYLNEKEYIDRFRRNIDRVASSKIDYKIKNAIAPYVKDDMKATVSKKNIMNGIPIMYRAIADERLQFLATLGKEVGITCSLDKNNEEFYSFNNPNWQDYLRGKEKTRIFEEKIQNEKVEIDNYNVNKRQYVEAYNAKIIDKKVVDYEKERVAFLVRDIKSGTLHYAEQNLSYDLFNFYNEGDIIHIKSEIHISQSANTGTKKNNKIKITKLDPETLSPILPPKTKRENKGAEQEENKEQIQPQNAENVQVLNSKNESLTTIDNDGIKV